MKKLMPVLLLPVFLLACGNEQKQGSTRTPADVKEHFKPIINGMWVEQGYLEELAKTRSPKAASAKLQGLVSMEINTAEIQGDSLVVAGSWNNHEGYIFTLHFKPGQDGQSLKTTHDYSDYGSEVVELSYEIKNSDTLLNMTRYNTAKKVIEKKSYAKVKGPQTPDSEPYGLQYMANKVLFSGKYLVYNEKNDTSRIELTDDGMVKGFEKFSTYYVYTDFLGDDFTNLDEMAFDAFTKGQKPFVFQYSDDTLKLYQALQNEDRTKLEQGPLKYRMVRTK